MAVGRANDSGVMLFGMGSTDENILKSLSNYKTEVNMTLRYFLHCLYVKMDILVRSK